jgi:hypothetical protein
MRKCFIGVRALGRSVALGAALSALAAGAAVAAPAPPAPPNPAPAPHANATVQSLATTAISALSSQTTTADSSNCGDPSVSQAFASFGDANWYTLAPGESPDSFDGTGWTLLNGASIQSASLYDGQTGSVLDLPSGAVAISPPMCVDSDYPTARTMALTTGGTQIAAGVFYAGAASNSQLQMSGTVQGAGTQFRLSQPLQVHPGNQAGWQMVQFIFGSTGSGDGKLYNFYVDPRMCR